MKLNATPRHYMPLSQNQSDEDESGPSKEDKRIKLSFKNSFDASVAISKTAVQSPVVKMNIKTLPMSPLRKFVFIASLIMCILFVVIFVYVIPCSPGNLDRSFHLTYKWKRIFYNMSFTSPLEFVNNNFTGTSIIILGFTNGEFGLVGIQENNGKELWKLNLHAAPLSAMCNVLDLNLDGVFECLIIGEKGLLAAVDVEKGATLWYLHNHSDIINAHSIHAPAIVSDCDNDGIKDIIVSYYLDEEENISYLAFVSGGTGQIIGSLIDVPHCTGPVTEQFSWKSENDTQIVLYCADNGNGNLWVLSSREACDVAFKITSKLSLKNIYRVPLFAQSIHFYKASSENQLIIVLDGVKFLLLEKSYEGFQVRWKTYVEGEQHMRIVTDGQFIKGSNQLVITSVNTLLSKLIGLSLNDGKIMWTIAKVNGSVKSGSKLSNYFGNTDGLILKTVSTIAVPDAKTSHQDTITNSSEVHVKEESKKVASRNDTRMLVENYVLVKYGPTPLMKTIKSEKIFTSCQGKECHPNTYVKDSTVLVKKSVLNSFDILTVSTSRLPAINTIQETIVNFLNLENILMMSTCNSLVKRNF